MISGEGTAHKGQRVFIGLTDNEEFIPGIYQSSASIVEHFRICG